MITFDAKMGIPVERLGVLNGATALLQGLLNVKVPIPVFRGHTVTTSRINLLVSLPSVLVKRCSS